MICEIDGCCNPIRTAGLCQAHYARRMRGKDMSSPLRTSPWVRNKWMEDHLKYDGQDCLMWPFSIAKNKEGLGYPQVRIDGKLELVSRVMCASRNGPPPSAKHMARHKCLNGRLGCVNPHHLEWGTARENQLDRLRDGTHGQGSRCKTSKLTEKDVVEIKSAISAGEKAGSIAKRYNVSSDAIYKIKVGKNWAWM